MSATKFILVDGRRTRVRLEGNPESAPILLLHGIGRSLEDWAPQYARLSKSHRIIAVDLPGSGFSARMSDQTTLEVLARGVLQTLDALEEQRPVNVIGNSLGGAVAMQLAVTAPNRVSRLVLVNSAGFGREVALLLRMLTLPILGDLAVRNTTRNSARMTESLCFADSGLVTPARLEHALAIAAQADTGTVMLETIRSLATIRGGKARWRKRLVEKVAQLAHPALVMWGDQDRVLPAHHLDEAARALPYAEKHLFANTGHMPQIERPDEFAERVAAFLGSSATAESAEGNAAVSAHGSSRRPDLPPSA